MASFGKRKKASSPALEMKIRFAIPICAGTGAAGVSSGCWAHRERGSSTAMVNDFRILDTMCLPCAPISPALRYCTRIVRAECSTLVAFLRQGGDSDLFPCHHRPSHLPSLLRYTSLVSSLADQMGFNFRPPERRL